MATTASLQTVYNDYRLNNGNDAAFMLNRELSYSDMEVLEEVFATSNPEFIKKERRAALVERVEGEKTGRWQLRDDLQWLSGTGRYGQ